MHPMVMTDDRLAAMAGPVVMAREAFEDPLEADAPGDASVTATRRALTRLALVAAETRARFQR